MGLTSSKPTPTPPPTRPIPKKKEKSIKIVNVWNNEDYIETKISENKLAPRTSPEYIGDEECNICFMDSILNRCNCCQNSICTNCFVLMKKKDSINIICPYCEFNPFDVTFKSFNNIFSPDDVKLSTKIEKVKSIENVYIPKSSVQDRHELEREIMETSRSPPSSSTSSSTNVKARRNTTGGLSPSHSHTNPNDMRHQRFAAAAETRRLANVARTTVSDDVDEDEDDLLKIMIDQAIKLSLLPDNNVNTKIDDNNSLSLQPSPSSIINKLNVTKAEQVCAKNIGDLLVSENKDELDSNEDKDESDDEQLKIAIALSLSANNKVDRSKINSLRVDVDNSDDSCDEEIEQNRKSNTPIHAISSYAKQLSDQSSMVEKIKSALKELPGTFSWEGSNDEEIGQILFDEEDTEEIFKSDNQIQEKPSSLIQNPLIFKTDNEI